MFLIELTIHFGFDFPKNYKHLNAIFINKNRIYLIPKRTEKWVEIVEIEIIAI